MRKNVLAVLLVVVYLLCAISAFAEEASQPQAQAQATEQMQKPDMMKKHHDMKKMMMHCMAKMGKQQMIATTDGGVIVMTGNKLLKYDKDLNLKKEVEIKQDAQIPRKMMQEKCPMKDVAKSKE